MITKIYRVKGDLWSDNLLVKLPPERRPLVDCSTTPDNLQQNGAFNVTMNK